MNLVKETLKLVQFEANKKANSAIENKVKNPDSAEFWQGQFQAFTEISTMIDNMLKIE